LNLRIVLSEIDTDFRADAMANQNRRPWRMTLKTEIDFRKRSYAKSKRYSVRPEGRAALQRSDGLAKEISPW
jgi:hypothetical protein